MSLGIFLVGYEWDKRVAQLFWNENRGQKHFSPKVGGGKVLRGKYVLSKDTLMILLHFCEYRIHPIYSALLLDSHTHTINKTSLLHILLSLLYLLTNHMYSSV